MVKASIQALKLFYIAQHDAAAITRSSSSGSSSQPSKRQKVSFTYT
jgi:hypothetical protein